MMKYKGRHINKGVAIQQHHQQNSTKDFACQKRKRLCTASLFFFFPLFEIIFNKVNKINYGMNNRKTGLK